jgi:hypothetical protein
MTDELVAVEGVPCPHDGAHPDGHVVSLRPKIGLEGAIYARQRIVGEAKDWNRVLAALSEAFVRYGVAEIDGKPATSEDIDALLADERAGTPVAERGDALYAESVLAPFVTRVRALSRRSQTGGSISPQKAGSPKRRRRSRPSSTSTTPTDSTATTSDVPV